MVYIWQRFDCPTPSAVEFCQCVPTLFYEGYYIMTWGILHRPCANTARLRLYGCPLPSHLLPHLFLPGASQKRRPRPSGFVLPLSVWSFLMLIVSTNYRVCQNFTNTCTCTSDLSDAASCAAALQPLTFYQKRTPATSDTENFYTNWGFRALFSSQESLHGTDERAKLRRKTSTWRDALFVIWQCKLVSGWKLRKRRSAPLY